MINAIALRERVRIAFYNRNWIRSKPLPTLDQCQVVVEVIAKALDMSPHTLSEKIETCPLDKMKIITDPRQMQLF